MPQRPWVARTLHGMHPSTRQYPLEPDEVPRSGDFVHLNGSNNIVQTTDETPAAILGISEQRVDVSPPGNLTPGFILVTVATDETIFAMEGSRAPLLTDIEVAYGIARDGDGIWTVDAAVTGGDARVQVVDVDLARNLWFVKVLAAYRQSVD